MAVRSRQAWEKLLDALVREGKLSKDQRDDKDIVVTIRGNGAGGYIGGRLETKHETGEFEVE